MHTRFLISQAVEGFTLSCKARRLSPHTIRDYLTTLRKLIDQIGDVEIQDLNQEILRGFLASQPVGKKTLLNYHTGLSAFLKWSVSEEILESNPLAGVPRPRPEQRIIQPIPEEHIRLILQACGRVEYQRDRKRIVADIKNKHRNRAIILLLLDTGLRATELCTALRKETDLQRRCLKVIGKGNKERILYFSPTTAQALWKCIQHDYPALFVNERGAPLNRDLLASMLYRTCDRAGVPRYSPHDFRHTFAVNFLRNYPNIYVLQQMLGHSTLDMVKRYLAISEQDMRTAQTLASPVERWKL